MMPRAGEEIEYSPFVMKRCRGAKYTETRDLDMRHAQRYSIHTFRVTRVQRAFSTRDWTLGKRSPEIGVERRRGGQRGVDFFGTRRESDNGCVNSNLCAVRVPIN